MEEIAHIMLYYAKNTKVPVCIHLDHGTKIEDCKKAIDLGFTSVMFDGSMYSYDENIELTKKVIELAHEKNVTVEAELGPMLNSSIGAGEGVSYTSTTYQYTEVSEAQDFINKTNVDCLAIAIGTMHGIYLEKPKLNLNRILEIKEATEIPLVLHGGSGLSVEEYKTVVKNGIRKINYYTYMNTDGGKAVKDYLVDDKVYIFFDELSIFATDRIEENVTEFMRTISTI